MANEIWKKRVNTPEARLINQSFFEKDEYTNPDGKKDKPKYKCEVVIPIDEATGEGSFEDHVIECVAEKWGLSFDEAAEKVENGEVRWYKDGDKYAKKREREGKPADAYKGMIILRPSTQYNYNGDDAPGGIDVWDEDVERITVAMSGEKLYRGCYGIVLVSANPYENNDGDMCVSWHLHAFQRTGDGEKLGGGDTSSLFKPVGRKSSGDGRRKRSED